MAYKKCALCGKPVIFIEDDLCKDCYNTYGRDANWIKEIIKIEKHNTYRKRMEIDKIRRNIPPK